VVDENRQLLESLAKFENYQEVVSAEDKVKINLLHSTTVSLEEEEKNGYRYSGLSLGELA